MHYRSCNYNYSYYGVHTSFLLPLQLCIFVADVQIIVNQRVFHILFWISSVSCCWLLFRMYLGSIIVLKIRIYQSAFRLMGMSLKLSEICIHVHLFLQAVLLSFIIIILLLFLFFSVLHTFSVFFQYLTKSSI